jgi:hypothetical protein
MSEPMRAHQLLSEFIDHERDRFESEHNNRFAFSFSKIVTYRRKTTAGPGRPGERSTARPRELKLLAEITGLQDLLHLDIESFYQFAKILLDKTAHSFGVYFGQQRNCSFGSFSRFNKALVLLESPFVITQEFRAECVRMEREISDYRDKRVVHDERADLVHAVTISNGRSYSITPACIRAKTLDDFAGSKDPRELLPSIDIYLSHFVECVRRNAAQTKLSVSLPTAS